LVLEALKRHLLAPEYVEEFISAFNLELNRQRLDAEVTVGLKRKELEEVNRRLNGLIGAIADGLRGPGLQAALDQLEDQQAALEKQLNSAPPPLPRFHPRLAEIYRDKVATLHTALAHAEERDQASQVLRSLIDRVVVRPGKNDRSFEIELVGEIANMVALLSGAESAERGPYRSSVKVVAGEGLEPPTLGL
jgi:site-specific DNA recombinase